MKTSHFKLSALFAVVICLVIAACKKPKEEEPPVTPPATTEETEKNTKRTGDQNDADIVSGQAIDDINSAIGQISSTRSVSICGCTIDSSAMNTGEILFTFDGTTVCAGKKRSGTIRVNITSPNGVHFSAMGAVAKLTFDNYKVKDAITNKSLQFDGWHTLKNLNGHNWASFLLGMSTIQHQVRGNVKLTNENLDTAHWNVATKRTYSYTYTGNKLNAQVEADTFNINGVTDDFAYWGYNRFGDEYTITMPTPLSLDATNDLTNCEWKFLTGKLVFHWSSSYDLTVVYGVDSNGNTVPAGTCPYGYKIYWTNNGTTSPDHIIAY